jgi:hypothetical protein
MSFIRIEPASDIMGQTGFDEIRHFITLSHNMGTTGSETATGRQPIKARHDTFDLLKPLTSMLGSFSQLWDRF